MSISACIHRGAAQVGGTCVELTARGQRLLLDLGMPLDAEDGEAPLPRVAGLDGSDPTLLGIVLSHLHGDHCGLVPHVSDRIPVAMGPTAARILEEARFFTGRPAMPRPRWSLRDREIIEIGPFRITPYQVEHSAVDAFALLVEAEGRRLFYTGDFRAHGNDRAPMQRLLADPPRGVDALLMEGTVLGDGRAADGPSEAALRDRLARRFAEWPGLVLATWSSQNLDRLRTLHEAALAAGRTLVVDLYTATLARAAALPGVPVPGSPGLEVYCRVRERLQVRDAAEFDRTMSVKRHRVYPEELAPRARQLVVMLRPSMVRELERAGALEGALAIWSVWPGYLEGSIETRMRQVFDQHHVPLEVHHVSGHAYQGDLRRLVEAMAPGRLVPIHTQRPDRYSSLSGAVELHADGEVWGV